MAILKEVLFSIGNVDSFIEALRQTDISPDLYQKILNERDDTELNAEEEMEIEVIEEGLIGIGPCEDCRHYFTDGEGFYHFDGDVTGALCEDCFRKRFPTDLDWYKYMLEVEEGLSKSEIAEMNDEEIEEESNEIGGNGDYCYYGVI